MIKEIYLAGGCFWGVDEYFSRIEGIVSTESGYANGKTKDTNYKILDETDHAETVRIEYNPEKISMLEILDIYFALIDPTSINKQGNDIGRQYRTGIYSKDELDLKIAKIYVKDKQEEYKDKIQVEVMKLLNYIKAEDYHQKYLKKNPGGYCHIDLSIDYETLISQRREEDRTSVDKDL